MKNLTKVYITKYALTTGLMEADMELLNDGKHCHGKPSGYHYNTSFFGNDFHLSKEDALKDCEKRRITKIKSLEKNIEKLKVLKFKIN